MSRRAPPTPLETFRAFVLGNALRVLQRTRQYPNTLAWRAP